MWTMMRLLGTEEGTGLAEYALLLVLLALVCVTVLNALGLSVRAVFNNGELQGALAGS